MRQCKPWSILDDPEFVYGKKHVCIQDTKLGTSVACAIGTRVNSLSN
jgi:hypothetical protein